MTRPCAPWIQTASGRAFDLLAPRAEDVLLSDIAIALDRTPRFGGHTRRAWSVADHSLLVCHLLRDEPPALRLAGLLHDAHEAYVGDLVTPLKAALGRALRDFATAWEDMIFAIDAEIHVAFGLPSVLQGDWCAKIKLADMQALFIERDQLMLSPPRPWIDPPEMPGDIPTLGDACDDDGEEFAAIVVEHIRERHGCPSEARLGRL